METTNKQLLEQINEAFERDEMEFYEAHLSDEIRWNILGDEVPVIGKKEYFEVLKMQELESFPEITVKNIIAEGDYVVIESTGKAITKTGKPYNQTYCDVYRLENGKIQEITTYLDTALGSKAMSED